MNNRAKEIRDKVIGFLKKQRDKIAAFYGSTARVKLTDERMGKKPTMRRCLACIIDGQIGNALSLIGIAPVVIIALTVEDPVESCPPLVISSCFWVLYFFWLTFAYSLFKDAIGSIGKRFLKLHVVDAKTGEPCSILQAVARNIILNLIPHVEIIIVLIRRDGRRVGDLAARTLVIVKKH